MTDEVYKSSSITCNIPLMELLRTENQACSKLYSPEQRDSQFLKNTGQLAHINTVSSPTNDNTKSIQMRHLITVFWGMRLYLYSCIGGYQHAYTEEGSNRLFRNISNHSVCLKHLWGYVIPFVCNLYVWKVMCVQQDVQYDGSHPKLKKKDSSNFLMLT